MWTVCLIATDCLLLNISHLYRIKIFAFHTLLFKFNSVAHVVQILSLYRNWIWKINKCKCKYSQREVYHSFFWSLLHLTIKFVLKLCRHVHDPKQEIISQFQKKHPNFNQYFQQLKNVLWVILTRNITYGLVYGSSVILWFSPSSMLTSLNGKWDAIYTDG